MKQLSTSALAKERNIEPKDLFELLSSKGWMYKKNDQWHLTKEGKMAGGEIKYNPKFGDYIVWPVTLNLSQEFSKENTVNSTSIGEFFNVSAQRINAILAELGWIEKSFVGGWKLTNFGKKNGGFEMEALDGTPYVIWDRSVLNNTYVLNSIRAATGEKYEKISQSIEKEVSTDEFRQKHEAKFRTQDGHRVRSKAEAMIDDYLYNAGIVHAYERRLPGIEQDVISDFYIPKGKVFIEFWGLEENKNYAERKAKKLEIYSKEKFNLIELNDNDIHNLDDVLPRKLRQYNINIS